MTRTALITGASSGIGKLTAETLANAGYRVIGTSRNAATDGEISVQGISMCQLDVCDDTSVATLKTRLEKAGSMPDLLVLNAGFGISGPIEETPVANAIEQFDTNVIGVHRVVRQFLPALRIKKRGRIIVIGSMLGRLALPFQAFYAASKSAVASYTEGLRMEVQPFGIKVSLIEPGDHQSDFGANRQQTSSESQSPYQPDCERALAIMDENERTGPSSQRVADMVLSVAKQPEPKVRYLCIQSSERNILWLKKLFSHARFERFVCKELGLTNIYN